MAIEKLHPVDAVVPHPELPEVISPELVLVDPELARIARRLLPERPPPPVLPPRPELAPARPVAAAAPHVFSPPAPRRAARRTATALYAAVTHTIPALAVGAVLLGLVASEIRVQLFEDQASLAAPTAPAVTPAPAPPSDGAAPLPIPAPETTGKQSTAPPPTPQPVSPAPEKAEKPAAPPPPAPQPVSPAPETTEQPPAPPPATKPKEPAKPKPVEWVPTKREVEIRALAALGKGGIARVPAGLIDERTGLLVDDVHVSCRRVGRTLRFTCEVGVGPAQPQDWRLTVVTSRDGPWKWRGVGAAG